MSMITAKIEETRIDGPNAVTYHYLPEGEDLANWIPQRFHYFFTDMIDQPLMSGQTVVDGRFMALMNRSDLDYVRFMNFCSVYYEELARVIEANPEHYVFPLATTYARMKHAIADGTFSKDSQAFKAMCKHFNIKHTYKAINAYLKGA